MKTVTVRKRYIEYTEQDCTHLKVEVYYHLGGANYFQGTNESRGLYVSVVPVTRSKGEGYTSESFVGFTGAKKLVLPMAKFSAKKCAEFNTGEIEKQLIEYVKNK